MRSPILKHKQEWEELERLVRRARRSIRSLTAEELSRLDVLYRRTCIHLAQVSTRSRDAQLLRYLNDLTASAHSVIYVPARGRVFDNVGAFFTDGFARAVARTGRYHAAAALLMLVGALLAYFAVQQDSTAAYALMPEGEFRLPGATREQLLEVLRHGRDQGHGEKVFFSSFLFQNNLQVGFLTLATGVLAAIPSVFLILYNGMILGAFTAIHHGNGIYAEYWAWMLPHGVTELTAVTLCGGIGLMLGRAVVSPGMMTRSESLRRAGIEAVRVTLGVAAMLVFAAVVESFLRQSRLATAPRLIFAAATLVFWASYFVRGAIRERMAVVQAAGGANE
jgi:uncharacterized membrane protein SpoIIM required for sporulation